MNKLCKSCGQPSESERPGSLTSFFFQHKFCQCRKKQGIEVQVENKICRKCGKSLNKNHRGSITSFMFQDLRCTCATPLIAAGTRTADRSIGRKQSRLLRETRLSKAENNRLQNDTMLAAFAPGTIIGGTLKIQSMIGEGGMGRVYLAHHSGVNQNYAVKILTPSLINETNWQRFKSEAKTLASLSHPTLVKVYDLGLHEQRVPYYSMDYLEGRNLEEILIRDGTLDLNTAIEIFLAVLDGLAYAHRHNVIHRDLKPANIFISSAPHCVKILDFGISKLIDSKNSQDLTLTGEVFGSPHYMSPEQCRGESVDARSDIYSIGCCLFETLTGFLPFEGETFLETATMHEEYFAPKLADYAVAQNKGTAFPQSLENVVARCLAKHPQERYQSAKELAIDLTSVAQGKEVPQFHSSFRPKSQAMQSRAREGNRSFPWLPMCLAAFTIFLSGAAAVLIYQALIAKTNVRSPQIALEEPMPQVAPPAATIKELETKADEKKVLEINDSFLKTPSLIDSLDATSPDKISIRCTRTIPDRLLNKLTRFLNVESLDCFNLSTESKALKFIDDFPKLSEINFTKTILHPLASNEQSSLSRLQKVSFIGDYGCSNLLEQLNPQTLTELSIKTPNLSINDIRRIAQFKKLTTLFLDSDSITNNELAELTALNNLQALSLYSTQIDGSSKSILAKFRKLQNLFAPAANIKETDLPKLAPTLNPNLETKDPRLMPILTRYEDALAN